MLRQIRKEWRQLKLTSRQNCAQTAGAACCIKIGAAKGRTCQGLILISSSHGSPGSVRPFLCLQVTRQHTALTAALAQADRAASWRDARARPGMAVPSNVTCLVKSQIIIIPVNSSQRRARLAVNAFPFGHRLRLLLRQSHTQPSNEGQHYHRAPLHIMNKDAVRRWPWSCATQTRTHTAINGMEGPSSAGARAGLVGATTESCTVSMGPLA